MDEQVHIPVDFAVPGFFLNEDQRWLMEIYDGKIENRWVSQVEAQSWLNRQPEMLHEKFGFNFLQLLHHACGNIVTVPPEVLQVLSPNAKSNSEADARVWQRARKLVQKNQKRRFMVTMLCKDEHWYWFIIDSLHMIAYWGDTLYPDDIPCPTELVWFTYQYASIRKDVLNLAHLPSYTFKRVPSPRQLPDDRVHCGALAATCIVAFFLRGDPSAAPIDSFDPANAVFLRQRLVLSYAKNSFLFRVQQPEKGRHDSPAKRIRVEEAVNDTPLSLPSAVVVLERPPEELPLTFIEIHPMPAGFSSIFTPTVKLLDCVLIPGTIFPSQHHALVCAVAMLSAQGKAYSTTQALQAFLYENYDISAEQVTALLAGFHYTPGNTAKIPKNRRPIRKQKSLSAGHWVLTEYGYTTFIKDQGCCTYTQMRYQQGRKTSKEIALTPATEKKQLLIEAAPLLSSMGRNHMDIVAEQLKLVNRPLSLPEIVQSIATQGEIGEAMFAQIKGELTTKVRQAVNTGARPKAKRSQRYGQFRVQCPTKKKGSQRSTLYAYLTDNVFYMDQIVEHATQLVQWKSFGTATPTECFLYADLEAQRKLFIVNAQVQLLPTETLYAGTLMQLPERANHWQLLNAPYGTDLRITEVHGIMYGVVTRKLAAGQPFTAQLND